MSRAPETMLLPFRFSTIKGLELGILMKEA